MKTIHLFGDKAYEVSEVDGRMSEQPSGRCYYQPPTFRVQQQQIILSPQGVRYEPLGDPGLLVSVSHLDGYLRAMMTKECGVEAVAESLAEGKPLPLWGDAAQAVRAGASERLVRAWRAAEEAQTELNAALKASQRVEEYAK